MKDSVQEFENLNNRIDKLFEGLGWLNPTNWLKDKPKYDEPNRNYTSGPALNKYLSKVESGECDFGVSNHRFSSDPGKSDAYFYNKSGDIAGYVKNIKPFLEKAGITKQTLRCYDLNKDKMKISWLFNGNFEADFLSWDRSKRKVIFQGQWKNPLLPFEGIESKRLDTNPITKPVIKTKPTVKSAVKPTIKLPIIKGKTTKKP